MFWLIVCLPKTCYGKCPLSVYSHSAAIKIFVCLRYSSTHPLCSKLKPFLSVLDRYVCLLPGDSLKSSWSQTKVELLNWLWGGKKRLRECNVSVSIQAAGGNKYWHVILSSLPSLSVAKPSLPLQLWGRVGGRVGVAGETDTNDIFSVLFSHLRPLLFPRLPGFFFFCRRPVVDLAGEKAEPFPTR